MMVSFENEQYANTATIKALYEKGKLANAT